MQKTAALLIILGVGALLLPLLGVQFTLVTELVKSLNASEGRVALGLIALGLLLGLATGAIPSRRGLAEAAWNDPGVAAARDKATPSIERILAQRDASLSEEAIRKIYPFFWEIVLRLRRERYDSIAASVAPRAGVSPEDVVMFNFAAMKAMAAQGDADGGS